MIFYQPPVLKRTLRVTTSVDLLLDYLQWWQHVVRLSDRRKICHIAIFGAFDLIIYDCCNTYTSNISTEFDVEKTFCHENAAP